MGGAGFSRRQTGGFLEKKIIGHGTVGNHELRCTGGADEITTPVKKRQVEVVAQGPAD
jgi:hypothetical protein